MDSAGIGRRGLFGGAGLLLAGPAEAAALAKPKVAIQTGRGVIVVELEAQKAPLSAANFLRYVDANRYDGGTFYRASRDPGARGEGTIEGGPSELVRRFPPIPHESTKMTGLRHKAGTLSLARNAPGTATGDFFICAGPEPFLDAHPGAPGDNLGFAAFGQVVHGMEVVRTILALPTHGKALTPMMKGQMLSPPVPIVSMKRMV
jgi:peptidyl-prolyl cis-trans isomerase A (cyclophilin A)